MSGLVETDSLEFLQQWMLNALTSPLQTDKQTINDIILPGGQLNAVASLAIYQRSYRLRLRKCLAEQFPATRYALGDALFDDFADEYLQQCPSDSYTLYELGRRFSDWLSASRPDAELPEGERESWTDFMIDLARYERELFRLFDAPGHPSQTWPKQDCKDSQLTLQPCLSLTEYRFPVAWYYHAVQADKAPCVPPAAASQLVILRKEYQTASYPISRFHFRFLHAVQHHGNVEKALVEIATWSAQPLEKVINSWQAEVKSVWIQAGFFIQQGIN